MNKGHFFNITLLIALVAALLPVGAMAAPPDPPDKARGVSTADFHKVIAEPGILDLDQSGITLWHDYGAFALYKVTSAAMTSLAAGMRSQMTVLEDADQILINAYPFDTQVDTFERIPQSLRVVQSEGPVLHLIQFVGPIKETWLDAVRATGATPVHYIANYGYLVWADATARAGLDSLAQQRDIVQFSALYQPYFKLGSSLQARIDAGKVDGTIDVTIQMYNHADKAATEKLIRELAVAELSPWTPILAYQNLIATVRVDDLETLAQQPDVFWIGERFPRQLYDEVQGQILAGNFDAGQTGPSAPGYLAFLNSYGFSTDPADYPIVDVTDDGIGDGTVNSGDYTLHYLGHADNASRLQYVANCTSEASGESVGGHGHINVSIAGGYDPHEGGGFPYEDLDGYLRGLGVSPYGRMAGTRIFVGLSFDVSNCGGTDTGLIKSVQDSGAQINTNSWGCSGCAGTYDDSSQAYDVGVRDADLSEDGNQELIIYFSAGNSGPSADTIGTPGNGKNMITVGASENDRPSDEDGNWTDGCGAGPTDADNAMDVIGFSSRGPAPGGRVKPEIIAPGTHIQGTASTSSSYDGTGVCDQYRPSGQTTFAASSGTSHSTPAAAGVGSLTYYWLENEYGITPSPAMMKAYMIAHPTYLTGVDANDDLPSNDQGYGMPNLQLAFDNTERYLLDQTHLFDNTGETWTYEGSVANSSSPVRIVLAYTDKAGTAGSANPEVNDLNLEVVVDGVTYLGNVFSGQWSTTGGSADADNNYEAVFLPAGTSGNVEITVTAFNVADDGVPNTGDETDQDFALVAYNVTQGATGILNGTVTEDGAGNPIENALVVASNPTRTVNLSTNAMGFYSNTIPAEAYTLTASAYGYNPSTVTNINVISGSTTTQDFALQPGDSYILSGTVTDANTGWGLFASVEVVPDGFPAQTIWTDPWTGAYSVTVAGNYSHTLNVSVWDGIPGYLPQSREININSDTVEDFALDVDAGACEAPGYAASSSTILSEDFESWPLPSGWNIVNHGGDCVWRAGSDGGGDTNETGGSGEYADADSDACGSGTSMDTSLETPVLDLTGYANPVLEFKSDMREYTSDTYAVDLSLDGGATWPINLLQRSGQDYRGPETITLPMPDAAGESNARVRFRYAGSWDYWWQVDDVLISDESCNAPASGGLIAGSVYNRYSLAPLTGATVANQDGYTQTAQITPDDDALGESFYVLYSPAGSKTFTATVSGYAPVALDNVPVVAGETRRQDFLFGNAFVSQQTGAWSGSAWAGGTPTATDWVTITTRHTVTVDSAAAACYGLHVEPGGTLIIPQGNNLTVEGYVENYGKMVQTKTVLDTTYTEFLHLRNQAGDETHHYGVEITPDGTGLGATTVSIWGHHESTTADEPGDTENRRIDIDPALQNAATVRFYYLQSELESGHDYTLVRAWHWDDPGWSLAGIGATTDLMGEYYYVEETGVSIFSPFVLKDSSTVAPTAVGLIGLAGEGRMLAVMLVLGLIAAGVVVRCLWHAGMAIPRK